MNDESRTDTSISLGRLRAVGAASVVHKPGVVRLDDYPFLVYAPKQHGEGVRTEDNGTHVGDICLALAETPDLGRLAERFGTTPDHVDDAIRYGIAVGFLAPEAG